MDDFKVSEGVLRKMFLQPFVGLNGKPIKQGGRKSKQTALSERHQKLKAKNRKRAKMARASRAKNR